MKTINLSKKRISTAAAIAIVFVIITTGTLTAEAKSQRGGHHRHTATVTTQTTTAAQDIASAQEILDELNEIRADYGYGALTMSADLTACAQVRSVEIASVFSHTRPGGAAWYTVNSSLMYGENLLRTQINHEADDIVQMWMDSPSHKDLILDKYYGTVGIASYSVNGTDYWALEFGYR